MLLLVLTWGWVEVTFPKLLFNIQGTSTGSTCECYNQSVLLNNAYILHDVMCNIDFQLDMVDLMAASKDELMDAMGVLRYDNRTCI